MTLAELAERVGGRVVGRPPARQDGIPAPDVTAVRVTGEAFLDSRTVVSDGLFVAIPGERADGHDHAAAAVTAGAAAYLGTRDVGVPGVVVEDAVVALGRLARYVVDSLPDLTVLALTGSQGKTGTKDYLAAVLASVAPTVATAGNLNNELGVPLTALRVTADTTYLVLEMGARGVGHIAELCAIAPPRVAAVLNVGTAHVGEFGSRERIAQAKGEILDGLDPGGTAVLNAGDPLTRGMVTRTSARVLLFGDGGDVAARSVTGDALGRCSFELGHAGQWLPVRLSQLGAHQVDNALAAATMAVAVGVPLESVARALQAAEAASRWRMELHERADGLVVVNDAYNANPESMAAALDTLRRIGAARRGRTVAVLGEMRELGEGATAEHRRVGSYAAAAGIDVLVTVGDVAEQMAEAAGLEAGWQGRAVVTRTRDEALAWVRENVSAADAVLVKASRGAALERVADGILEEGDAAR